MTSKTNQVKHFICQERQISLDIEKRPAGSGFLPDVFC